MDLKWPSSLKKLHILKAQAFSFQWYITCHDRKKLIFGLFSEHKSIEFVLTLFPTATERSFWAKAPTEVSFNNSESLFTYKTGGFENWIIGWKFITLGSYLVGEKHVCHTKKLKKLFFFQQDLNFSWFEGPELPIQLAIWILTMKKLKGT